MARTVINLFSATPLRSCLIVLLCLSFADATLAQSFGRVLDSADLTETPAHYDLVISFNCPVRYVTHSPAGQGANVTIRLALGSECGTGNHNETLESPEPAVVRSIELQSLFADEAQLVILWRGPQQYLIVPTADQRGLRIRVLRAGESSAPQARVIVADVDQGVITGYAINLESSLTPFDDTAIKQAQSTSSVRAYTSQITIDNQRWYRLRLGPIVSHSDAQKILEQAKPVYPRAWLAIADENINADTPVLEPESGSSDDNADTGMGAEDRAIDDPQADELWKAAREKFHHRDYAATIQLLTKLLNQSSHKYRAAALELSGITHERMAQLAHATEEYETFLREFPKHDHAARVRRRLNALRTATLPGHTFKPGYDDEGSQTWRVYGGVAQYYRRDNGSMTVTNPSQPADATANNSQNFTSLNALINDVDVTARYRGLDVDTRARFSGGYTWDFLKDGPGNQVRVNNAFVEFSDRDKGWYASAGRQTRTSGGLLGTFDGVLGSYRFYPHFTLDAAAGFPVDTSYSGANTQRRFESLAANFGIFADAFEPTIYAVNQSMEGFTDRRAVGFELRYFRPGRVLVAFADYDVYFHTLSSAVVVATLQLPWRWTLNMDVEERKSPIISTRNALIGQPVQTLTELSQLFTADDIKQLAQDRTSQTSLYSIVLSRPLGEQLQLTLNAQRFKTGETQASGGVEGFNAIGPETIASVQLLAASIFHAGDINIIGVRYQTGGPVKVASFGINTRLPFHEYWRIGPQISIDRQQLMSDNSVIWTYRPGLRITLQRHTLQVDLEAGDERLVHNTVTANQRSTRMFYSLGYRWQF